MKRECHSCPISEAIQSGAFRNKKWNELPCCSCESDPEYFVSHHGRGFSLDDSRNVKLQAETESTLQIRKDANEQSDTSRAVSVLGLFLNLDLIEREAIVHLLNGKGYREIEEEFKARGLEKEFKANGIRLDFRRIHERVQKVLDADSSGILASVITKLHLPQGIRGKKRAEKRLKSAGSFSKRGAQPVGQPSKPAGLGKQ